MAGIHRERPGARAVAADAREALIADTEKFWERAWLTRSIDESRTHS